MKIILNSIERINEAKSILSRLEQLSDFSKVFSLSKPKKRRTNDQNALYWLWLTCLEVDSETGYTKDEFHEIFKEKFAPRKQALDVEIKSTKFLDTKEMSEYMEKIRMFCWHELTVSLPNPDDRGFNEFYEKYI